MIVTTPNGSIRGQQKNGIAVFRGIPYAKPPVGDRRFLAPEPTTPWEGTRDALEFGPRPPQSQAWGTSEPAGDDWLTANVWTPDTSGSLPVIVWAYGGAYRGGSASDPQYDGGKLANNGVVLVTANHRVGMEGYGLIDGAPANRGILDQIEVLRWVQRNIASFGGDAGNVTVMGESAGAGSSAALLGMPDAAGLFHRMILQSTPGFTFSQNLGTAIADAVANEVGRTRYRDDLLTVSTSELEAAADAISASLPGRKEWGPLTHLPTPLSPIIGDESLPETVFDAVASGRHRDIDLLVTHTRVEGRVFLAMAGKLGKITDADATEAIALLAPDPGAFRAQHEGAAPQALLEAVVSDWMFRAPSERIAALHTAAGGRAYLAEFDWTPSGAAGALGPTHATDLPLVFGNPSASIPEMEPYKVDERYEAASATVRTAWTAFATTGDPGWPDYANGTASRITDDGITSFDYQGPYPTSVWTGESFSPIEKSDRLGEEA